MIYLIAVAVLVVDLAGPAMPRLDAVAGLAAHQPGRRRR